MRIILDVGDVSDARKALDLALSSIQGGNQGEFGYWSRSDPTFSAYVRPTKTGVSVHARRREDTHDGR